MGNIDIDTLIEQRAKAPRVTPADIDAAIESEWYINAGDAIKPDGFHPPVGAANPLRLLTFCVLILKNGFTVTGESACASAANFDDEIGRRIARKNAVEKIWPLLGFRLRDKLQADEDAGQGALL